MKELIKLVATWRYFAMSCFLCATVHTNAQDFIRDYDLYSETTHLSNTLEITCAERGQLWGGWRAYNPNAQTDYMANGGKPVKTGVASPWVMHTYINGQFTPSVPTGTHTFGNIYRFQQAGTDIIVTSARVTYGNCDGPVYVCVYNTGESNIGMMYMYLDRSGNVLNSQGYQFNSGVTAAEVIDFEYTSGGYVVIGKVHYGGRVKMFAAKIDYFGRINWNYEYDINPIPPLTEANENPKTLFYDWVNHTVIIGGDAEFLQAAGEDAFMLVLDEASGNIVQTLRFPMPGLYGGDASSSLSDIEVGFNTTTGFTDYIATGHVRDVHIMPWMLRVQRDRVPTNITGSWVYDLPINSGDHPFYLYAEGTNIDQVERTLADRTTMTYRMAGEIYANNDPISARGNFMMNIDNSGNATTMYLFQRDPLSYRSTKGMGSTLVATSYPSLNVSPIYSAYDDGTDRYPTMINNITPTSCYADSEAVHTNPLQPSITLFGVMTNSALVTSPITFISMYSDTSNIACNGVGHKYSIGNTQGNNTLQTIKVYPNPATSDLTIDAACTNAEVTILNIEGTQISTVALGADGFYHYNVSELPSGLYLVRVNNGTNYKVLQFTKI